MKTTINNETPVSKEIDTMNRSNHRLTALALAVALGIAAGPASAFEFETDGELTARLDTTVSYGASWRVEDRCEDCIGKAQYDPLISLQPLSAQIAAPGRFSINSDNGNLNYDDGDLVSHAIKITTELELKYRNFGGFFRATGFYDFENADNDNLRPLTGRFRDARDIVGTDVRMLDAFLYYDFDIGEFNTGTVRLGRQVVSWGESTFIQGGINVVNPVDVSKLRVAGAELKEAFLPIDMVYGSFSLTPNLSVEALYMFEFEQIEPDPNGSYFSTNDFGTPAGEYVMLGFGLTPEMAPAVTIGREFDRNPDDGGQYGVALRYYAEGLNTEFGLYYLNYHSRLPLVSGTAVTSTELSSGTYFLEYPEDIEMYGFSFNTEIGGIAFQGEVSYRDNQPFQIDDVEVLFTALSPLNALIPAPGERFISQLGQVAPGAYVQGWEEHEATLYQMTVTKILGPTFGSDQMVMLGEIGAQKVWDLPEPSVLRYQADGTDTGGGPNALEGGNLRNPVRSGGFAEDFSWGYRLVARLDYNSAFGSPINLFPRIAFNHDVDGTSPGPGGNFIEDRKSLTLGLAGSYLEKWRADLAYTRFFGAGQFNLLQDRDFVAFNISYAF